MEALVTLKGVGLDVLAFCPICKKWINDVEIIEGCHPYNRDCAYCPICKTGILRSSPPPQKKHDETCMNPHIDKVCDADCQIYTECMGNGD